MESEKEEDWDQKKGAKAKIDCWTVKCQKRKGQKQETKTVPKCTFRLMAHHPDFRVKHFLAPCLNEAGSLITVATDETMGIDMTLSF